MSSSNTQCIIPASPEAMISPSAWPDRSCISILDASTTAIYNFTPATSLRIRLTDWISSSNTQCIIPASPEAMISPSAWPDRSCISILDASTTTIYGSTPAISLRIRLTDWVSSSDTQCIIPASPETGISPSAWPDRSCISILDASIDAIYNCAPAISLRIRLIDQISSSNTQCIIPASPGAGISLSAWSDRSCTSIFNASTAAIYNCTPAIHLRIRLTDWISSPNTHWVIYATIQSYPPVGYIHLSNIHVRRHIYDHYDVLILICRPD